MYNRFLESVALVISIIGIVFSLIYGETHTPVPSNNTVNATVCGIENDLITVDIDGEFYSYFGDGVHMGQPIKVVLKNDCIIDVVE